MTGFTNSQKLSWMNNLIIALEIAGSVFSEKFKATGYEWKQYEEMNKKPMQTAALLHYRSESCAA